MQFLSLREKPLVNQWVYAMNWWRFLSLVRYNGKSWIDAGGKDVGHALLRWVKPTGAADMFYEKQLSFPKRNSTPWLWDVFKS